ncbi:RdRP-domain-containing protein [Bimuria novae-zelandiae CBS 107.79]|uniref:RNA-dependent RNA polymerase n=1 Tax=Bimuria novae-zelandiae CBS 107.79 TaxID=1447943 RepID=A0A6A5V3M0_9PLEO|nr:RdRP-domain-containing protein [Bimuria novae-zelandiae CBS 107.79]
MEVFMTNLPMDLTDRGLNIQLKPLAQALGIKDWSCQKAKKRTFGSVTFLRRTDGQQFLARHGQVPVPPTPKNAKPRPIARMKILGSWVFCKLSTNKPDPYTLRALERSAEERRELEQLPYPPEEPKIVFSTTGISCGTYNYVHDELVYCPEIEWLHSLGTAKFAKKALLIDFNYGAGGNRIEIPYRIVETVIISSRPTALTLTLWETPHFFGVQEPELANLMSLLSLRRSGTPKRQRLTELPHPTNAATPHNKIITQAMIYHLSVTPSNFYQLSDRLIQRGVLTVIRHDLPVQVGNTNLFDASNELNETIKSLSQHLPFPVLYQMEALAKNGYLPPWTVQKLVCKAYLNSRDATKTQISAEAFRKLLSQIPFPSVEISESTFDVEELWRYAEQNQKDIDRGLYKELITERGRDNLTMVHKVNITPTGITLHGPDPEAKNRVLRRFSDQTEYFIRVQFCDEDGTDLRFNSKVSNDDVYDRFRQIMNRGIQICGRTYGFLGYSHSSLRNHSAWFVAPFFNSQNGRLESYHTIIPGLGEFTNIYSPARCAARIGQAFSETPFAISLKYNGIKASSIPEVSSADGRHVFSDGVGTLSREAVELIQDSIPPRKGGATCFQIRWGGAKGMLGLDSRLEGCAMNVRASMVKFDSTDVENLEICDAANKPIPLVLNRQMIKILEDMGIPASWFLKQQANALSTLQLVTAHISNTAGFLKRKNIADSVGFPQLIRGLESAGIDYRRDHFMRSVVEAALLREIRLMKYKARIPIAQGVTLFGIMDETGYLEEGEIFVTFDQAPFIDSHPLDLDNRQMLITRSPALHPGDIQIATNIIPPSHHPLRALRNCIVFSQKGTRDLPSCLSGGDLDGDTYSVIWDSVAVNGCRRVWSPAKYPRVIPKSIGRPVKQEDITDFFIKFMATDQLGLIANRHMILADQREEGTLDAQCLLLAELHSTQVDYSKSGVPIDTAKLNSIRPPRYRPHFLAPSPPTHLLKGAEIAFDAPTRPREDEDEDDDDNSGPRYLYYRSEKINGLLFDAIDEKKIWYKSLQDRKNTDDKVWNEFLKNIIQECNRVLGGISWNHMSTEAANIRLDYEDAIYNATVDYSSHPTQALTELEVFTGSIFSGSGVQSRRQRDRSLQLKDEFDRIARWVEKLIRRRTVATGDQGHGEDGPSEDTHAALQRSIACLEISQLKSSPFRAREGRSTHEFQSFKIVSACCAMRELNAATKRAEADEW